MQNAAEALEVFDYFQPSYRFGFIKLATSFEYLVPLAATNFDKMFSDFMHSAI